MAKVVYLIVKSRYDGAGNLLEVTPLVVYNSKRMAEDSFPGFKKVEYVYKRYSSQKIVYELKDVEII